MNIRFSECQKYLSSDEFFILQGKKQGVRIEGEGYVIREFSYSDCESLAENADNNKIWNNLMDNFPHPYTKQDAFDYISMVKAMPGKPMRFAIEVEGKAVGSIGFGSEGYRKSDCRGGILDRGKILGAWHYE